MRRRPATVTAILSLILLAGCGTGLQAQTYKEKGRQDFTSTDLDALAIRNLHVIASAPQGGDAVLTGAFVNRGTAPDRLRDVASDLASSVEITVDGVPATGVAIPPGGSAGNWTAILHGLTKDVRAGQYLTVTLTFATSGRTTLSVPVQIGDNGLIGREVQQKPYGEGG